MTVSVTYTLSPGAQIKSSELNTNFSDLVTGINAIDSGATTYGYRRPVLTYISATTIDVESNTSTSNQTKVVFPDGEARSVTEDTSSTSKYRRFIITETAEFTTGTENSGLYTGLSEATNTWYAIYAVKSQISTSNFVLVGTTTLPTQGNMATLNTNLGANSWVFLGYVRNGDQGSTTGNLLSFKQAGNTTMLNNDISGNNSGTGTAGMILVTSASATSVTWTSALGSAGAVVPNTATILFLIGARNTGATDKLFQIDNSANQCYFNLTGSGAAMSQVQAPAENHLRVTSATTAVGLDGILIGWVDGSL